MGLFAIYKDLNYEEWKQATFTQHIVSLIHGKTVLFKKGETLWLTIIFRETLNATHPLETFPCITFFFFFNLSTHQILLELSLNGIGSS